MPICDEICNNVRESLYNVLSAKDNDLLFVAGANNNNIRGR